MQWELDTLGKRLSFVRRLRGLTQEQLAVLAGIGQPSIASLESGRSKGSRFVHKLSAALGVSEVWLTDGGPLEESAGSQRPEIREQASSTAPFSAFDEEFEEEHAGKEGFQLAGPEYLDTLAKRLVFARERCGFTQGQLAKKAGLSQATVGNLETGRNHGSKRLVQLAQALHVTSAWLSEGGDYNLAKRHAISSDFGLRRKDEAVSASIQSLLGRAKMHPPVPEGDQKPLVPVLGWDDLRLADPLQAYTSPAAKAYYVSPYPHSPESFFLQVMDDSMSPEYREHELILVDPRRSPGHQDDVVAVNADGHPIFSRLKSTLAGQFLTMLNPAYPSQAIPLTDDMTLVGTVIASMIDRTRRAGG